MKKFIKKLSQGLLLVPAIALMASVVLPVAPVAMAASCDTQNLSITNGAGCAQGKDQPTELFGDGGIFETIVNILLFLIGAVSVIMLIYGGIRYTISGGDSTAVTSAKNTILYAVVGIVVAVLAFAVVNFVIKGLTTTS